MRAYVSCLLLALVAAVLIPISASAQTDAECVAVYDADGTRVARSYPAPGPGETIVSYLLFDGEGSVAFLFAELDEIKGKNPVFFTGPGCTGDAYMERTGSLQPFAHLGGNEVWYPDTTATLTSPLSQSFKPVGTDLCFTATQTVSNSVPAFNFTLPAFTPPFHLEPEPCFTPEDPDPEQIINGCIRTNGTLKIVDDPAGCSSRETPISWLGQ